MSIIPALIVVASLVAAWPVYMIIKFFRQMWKFRKFTGPFPVPILGNVYDLEAMYFMKYLSKLRKKYGKFFRFIVFSKAYLVVCEPIAVRRILTDAKTFIKGYDYTKHFSVVFGNGLVTSSGERHKHDRSIFGKYFIRSSIAKFMSVANKLAFEAIEEMLIVPNKKATVHNIEEFYALLALRTFMSFSVGKNFSSEKELEKLYTTKVSESSWLLGRFISMGIPMWKWLPPVKEMCNVRDRFWADTKRIIIDERRRMYEKGEDGHLDDCLTAMFKENMDEQTMNDHMITLLSAGHDTTAYFGSYMTMLLAQHPDVQEKVRNELKDVVGSRQEITADDVTNMKYLTKVMQEVLRLYSIIPCVSRFCTEDLYIKEIDVTLPRGTELLIPMFLINRDPDLWKDPNEFNPDRFNDTDNFTSANSGYFPFGYGTRVCIGNTLAQYESAVFLCQLLRRFRLTEDNGFKPNIFSGISLTTSNGINVTLQET